MAYYVIIFIMLVLLSAGLVMSLFTFKLKREEYKNTGKYPRGHYMGQGLAIGIVAGIPIAIALGSIFAGYIVALLIGTFIGSKLEKKHVQELRPLTYKEKELKKKTNMIFRALFAIGIIAYVLIII